MSLSDLNDHAENITYRFGGAAPHGIFGPLPPPVVPGMPAFASRARSHMAAAAACRSPARLPPDACRTCRPAGRIMRKWNSLSYGPVLKVMTILGFWILAAHWVSCCFLDSLLALSE